MHDRTMPEVRDTSPYASTQATGALRTTRQRLFAGAALHSAALLLVVALLPGIAVAQDLPTPDDPIAYAMSAGPASIAADATIMAPDGSILREGTNEWTCIPMPGEPMCMDQQWLAWLDAYVNQRDVVDVTSVGLSYMLRGDQGASNIDPYAEGPTADNEWVVTGPHLMVIVPDPALLEGIPSDPMTGGPYVMWRDHPLVHVMIPVDDAEVSMPYGP